MDEDGGESISATKSAGNDNTSEPTGTPSEKQHGSHDIGEESVPSSSLEVELLVLRRGVAEDSMPGAYALAPTQYWSTRNNERGRTTRQPAHASASNDQGGSWDTNRSIGMVSAYPVSEEACDEELAQAEPVDLSRRTATILQQQKRYPTMLILWLLAAMVVALFLSFLLQNQTNTTTPPSLKYTPPPSFTPTGPLDTLFDVFPSGTIESLTHPTSPQSQAYNWLLNHPSITRLPDWRKNQLFALASIYFGTHGHDWHNDDSWLSYSVHECLWFAQDDFLGFARDDYSYIHVHPNPCEIPPEVLNQSNSLQVESNHQPYTHLWLHSNSLRGSIPQEMFFGLPELRSILLYNNPDLARPIPSSIGNATKLYAINLGATGISGTLPSEVGMLSDSLTSIAIVNANLEGPLPTEIGLLHQLHDILVDQNQLTGTIPLELSQATNLVWIYLAENLFSGTFPVHLTTLPLEELVLDQCHFTGTLPTEVGLLTAIYSFYIFANQITGTLPTEFGLMIDASWIFLDENKLTGTLPTELGMMVSMRNMYLFDNQMSGTIPSELGTWHQVETLAFGTNSLSGSIPTQVARLPNLAWLETYNNLMTGYLPTQLGLAPLQGLMLENNLYNGTIPEELSPQLWYLLLQENPFLTGTIPSNLDLQASNYTESWHPPVLNITGTGISGTIPESVCATELLLFDCSFLLCGCDCNCSINSQNGNTSWLPKNESPK